MSNRSIVYIDGFNLYYGAIRRSPYKWLNIQSFFLRLRQDDDIQRICYFCAMVAGSGRDRQETYMRALATLPLVEVILGRYKLKQVNAECKPARRGATDFSRFPRRSGPT